MRKISANLFVDWIYFQQIQSRALWLDMRIHIATRTVSLGILFEQVPKALSFLVFAFLSRSRRTFLKSYLGLATGSMYTIF